MKIVVRRFELGKYDKSLKESKEKKRNILN